MIRVPKRWGVFTDWVRAPIWADRLFLFQEQLLDNWRSRC